MRRAKPKSQPVQRLSDLPRSTQELITDAGIEQKDVDNSEKFDSLLNALHIRAKERFFTREGFEKMRAKSKRRNTGPSTVSPDIVSTAALDVEQKELLQSFKEEDYTFIKKLGGFGHVFLAEEKETKERVAVKKMPHVTEKQQRKNFQEIRFLNYCTGHLAHGIVEFRRATVILDEMWLLTEQIDGGTLTQAVTKYKFAEPEIAYIVHELLQGLKFLHDNLIAHRDMKSVLGKNGDVKIIDFGLCSDTSGGEVVHRVGSPFWLPPEMINHQPHGLPVDIWSFGICCMEMVNGHPPHHRSALRAMFIASTEGYPNTVEDKSKWSSSLQDFIGRCVCKDPKSRWTSTQLLNHEFVGKRTDRAAMSVIFTNIFSDKRLHM